MELLDLDGNGQLDQDEVIGVLMGRNMLGQGKEEQLKEAINYGIRKGFQWIRDTLRF